MDKQGLITLEYVKTIVRERPRDAHKGTCGRVLVVAGSLGMAGAAVLSSEAALKSGAGLVKAAVPDEIIPILQIAVPQATCCGISDDEFLRSLEVNDAIAVGPGIGVGEKQYLLIKKLLESYEGPVIIDADGINDLCRYDKDFELLKNRKIPAVLTPHPGEGNRILEALGESDIASMGRIHAAELISRKTGTVVLLKGADTVVPWEFGGTYTNTTGNPGMATGGSGDVLTGVIAAIAASGEDPFDAAKAGAFIHGMAGDIAAEHKGQWGMTSADIKDSLPDAFKEIVGK